MEVRRRLWWDRGIAIDEDRPRCGEEVMARGKSSMHVSSVCLLFGQGRRMDTGLHELVFPSGNSIDNLHGG